MATPGAQSGVGPTLDQGQPCSPGSLIAMSTLTDEHADPALSAELDRLRATYSEAGEPICPRDHAELLTWFDGLNLVESGLVTLPEWHNDDAQELTNPARPLGYGLVARVS